MLENLAYTHVRDTGAITTLAQSPAIDILAVGYASGVVALFDVRLGASLFAVRLEPPCPVTAVSFRSDAGSSSEEQQLMVVASERGDLAVFDLAQKARSVATVRSAHMSSIAACTFVAGQPLFMTCGEDNALRQWVIDSPAAPPRLLRERSGHRSPPHLVRYYADDGKSILSAAAGIDRSLRLTSVVRDSRGFELSQGAVKREASKLAVDPSLLKYEPVRRLAHATQRSRDWDDVLTIHEQSGSREDRIARTWSVNKKRVGKWQIVVEGEPTATCVSACGNFGLVGSSKGQVVLFNMQSGIKRKVFRLPARAAVTGLATDVLNRTVIVSTDLGDLHVRALFLTHDTELTQRSSTMTFRRPSLTTVSELGRPSPTFISSARTICLRSLHEKEMQSRLWTSRPDEWCESSKPQRECSTLRSRPTRGGSSRPRKTP